MAEALRVDRNSGNLTHVVDRVCERDVQPRAGRHERVQVRHDAILVNPRVIVGQSSAGFHRADDDAGVIDVGGLSVDSRGRNRSHRSSVIDERSMCFLKRRHIGAAGRSDDDPEAVDRGGGALRVIRKDAEIRHHAVLP